MQVFQVAIGLLGWVGWLAREVKTLGNEVQWCGHQPVKGTVATGAFGNPDVGRQPVGWGWPSLALVRCLIDAFRAVGLQDLPVRFVPSCHHHPVYLEGRSVGAAPQGVGAVFYVSWFQTAWTREKQNVQPCGCEGDVIRNPFQGWSRVDRDCDDRAAVPEGTQRN